MEKTKKTIFVIAAVFLAIFCLVFDTSAQSFILKQTPKYNLHDEVEALFEVQKTATIARPKKGSSLKIYEGNIIAVKLPREYAEKMNKEDLSKIIEQADLDFFSAPAPFYHEIEIIEARRGKENLNRKTFVNLAQLSKLTKLKSLGYEELDTDITDIFLSEDSSALTVTSNNQLCLMCNDYDLPNEPNYIQEDILNLFLPQVNEFVEVYENSPVVENLINQAKRNISFKDKRGRWFLRTHSTKKCLRYVKLAIKKASVIMNELGKPVYLTLARAKDIGSELTKYGFLNLLKTNYKENIPSPYHAPTGAILVYEGGRYGHVEIRTRDGFISDYYSKVARTGSPFNGLAGRSRRLVGVYIMPGVKSMADVANTKNYTAQN